MIPGSHRLLIAALLFVAVACATRPAPLPTIAPSEALRRLGEDEVARTSLRGLARVRVEAPGRSVSASQVVLVALPDKARLEAQSAVGTTAVVVVLQGDQLRVQNFIGHEYLWGRATPQNLGRLAGVPVPSGPLLRLLLGLPPLPVRADDPRLRLTSAQGEFLIETVDGRLWQRVRLDAAGRVAAGELGEGEAALVRFQFEDYRGVNSDEFPYT
ncbi:MAG TPA: DUF4292 domain-containing protein, partial [Candidatus Sulfotelmatobacter sp.]|nr:DUF4292 domain-containing protein [Candidatus Sulfotelmatobacter sp.]